MRVFTAIPLPEEIKKKVGEITKNRLSVSYVNTTNLHITLNFFDELTDDEVERVKKIFPQIATERKKFLVSFDKLTKFRQQIHMTIKPNQELARLQSDMGRAFESNGFRFQERAYYPHVKLANLHMDHVMNQQRKIENFPNNELEQLEFISEKIILYESKLLLHHAHHYPILEQQLK